MEMNIRNYCWNSFLFETKFYFCSKFSIRWQFWFYLKL